MTAVQSIRSSGSWYLTAIAVGVVLERFANYLWYETPIVWGQAPSVLSGFIYFGIALAFWLLLVKRSAARGTLSLFLAGMSVAWVAHWILFRVHGDSFNYTGLLYIPILIMIWLKPPQLREVRLATLGMAWTISIVLLATRLLEMIGILSVRPQVEGVVQFDTARYFLPLNDLLGIEGRWPGPFGHNGDTAMMGALLLVVAIAFWSRSSWFFLAVGGLTLVLTNGRASIGAAAAGLVLIGMFSKSPRLRVVPRGARIMGGGVFLLLGALFMFGRPAGLTGRDVIWPAFIGLWLESPWVGVGSEGIASGNEVTQAFGHAHSLYIDELARWGLAGFVTQFAAIGIGVFIAAKAAGLGFPGPLAVIATYLITGVTEPRNNWIVPSATGFLLILMVLAASAYLARHQDQGADDSPWTRTSGADARPKRERSGSPG